MVTPFALVYIKWDNVRQGAMMEKVNVGKGHRRAAGLCPYLACLGEAKLCFSMPLEFPDVAGVNGIRRRLPPGKRTGRHGHHGAPWRSPSSSKGFPPACSTCLTGCRRRCVLCPCSFAMTCGACWWEANEVSWQGASCRLQRTIITDPSRPRAGRRPLPPSLSFPHVLHRKNEHVTGFKV